MFVLLAGFYSQDGDKRAMRETGRDGKRRLAEQSQWHRTSERIAGSLASPPANVHLAARTPETHPSPSPLTVTMVMLCLPALFFRRAVYTDHEITSFSRQTGTHTILTDFLLVLSSFCTYEHFTVLTKYSHWIKRKNEHPAKALLCG